MYVILMRPNKVETAVPYVARKYLPDLLVMVIPINIRSIPLF